jgi:hypothetical protein
MARAITLGRTSHYLPVSVFEADVERLRGNSLRAYLERRLQSIEERLAYLYEHYEAEQGEGWWIAMTWGNQQPDDGYWDGVFELDYLEATRAALLETLRSLPGRASG